MTVFLLSPRLSGTDSLCVRCVFRRGKALKQATLATLLRCANLGTQTKQLRGRAHALRAPPPAELLAPTSVHADGPGQHARNSFPQDKLTQIYESLTKPDEEALCSPRTFAQNASSRRLATLWISAQAWPTRSVLPHTLLLSLSLSPCLASPGGLQAFDDQAQSCFLCRVTSPPAV